MTEEPRTLYDLDEIDLAIIRLLQEQGRTSNAQIARVVGVSEPTVRKRIDRMVAGDIVKVVAVLNPHRTGYATDVLIGIRVQPGRLLEVGRALAALEHVVYVGYTTGRHDILAEALFRDDEELFDFLEHDLPALGGVVSTETAHVLRTGKINYEWKLPEAFGGRIRSGSARLSRGRASGGRPRRARPPRTGSRPGARRAAGSRARS